LPKLDFICPKFPNKIIKTNTIFGLRFSFKDELEVTGPDVQLKILTVLGEKLITCQKVNDLVVHDVNEDLEVLLPQTYSRECGQIPKPESVLGWPHLKRLSTRCGRGTSCRSKLCQSNQAQRSYPLVLAISHMQ